nr:MAG TPA: repressor protein [Caudoviricetes sp.]
MYNDILRRLRAEKGVSQQVVADYLNITKQAYSLYELGKREPDFETLLKLGEYFNVSTDYILRGEDIETSSDNDIKFALFNGSEGVTDEMFEEVKQFAAMVKMREDAKKKKEDKK